MRLLDYFLRFAVSIILFVHSELAENGCEKFFEGNQCVPLNNKTCFTGNLTYNYTSHIFVAGHLDEFKELIFWENLKSIPKCWDVVRPVLCAIYLPRCDYNAKDNKSVIQLPKRKMCDFMKGPCKIVEELQLWPTYLNCNHAYYSEDCHENTADIRFSPSASCKYPLVKANHAPSWYPGFEGCSFGCQNPWFTEEDHVNVHFNIVALCLCCIACNFFVVLTFVCNWRRLANFPDAIILYMNACYIISSFGWLFQFLPDLRNIIVCKLDGTTKRAESQFRSDESALCTIVFVLIYFFTLASMAWLVVLSYTWQIAFETSRDQVNKKKAYFHLGVWVLSIVFTVLCLAFTKVDGDTLTGICFISSDNFFYRGIFVILPISILWIAGLSFLMKGLLLLQNMRSQSPDLLSKQKKTKLRSSIIRIGIFMFALILFGITALGLLLYVFMNLHSWEKSMREFVICSSNVTGKTGNSKDCLISDKPSKFVAYLSISCYFGFGILLSSWLWRTAAFRSWKYCFMSKFGSQCTPTKSQGVRISEQKGNFFNPVSETEDLIGMDFDLNSMTSFDVSSISSILTTNRRHSDSDVSSFEKRLSILTKSHTFEPKENCLKSNRESLLSSSEWSGSESQKSHLSTDISLQGGCYFIKASFESQKQDMLIEHFHNVTNEINCIKNVPKMNLEEAYTPFAFSVLPIGQKLTHLNLSFDLQSFRAQTLSVYDNLEESVLCFENVKEIFNQKSPFEFEDYETFDSSNSNYTLASSDSNVLSIKPDEEYFTDDQSIDSLIGKTSKVACVHKFIQEDHIAKDFYEYKSNPDSMHVQSDLKYKLEDNVLCKECQTDICLAKDLTINWSNKNLPKVSEVQKSSDGDESGNVTDLDIYLKINCEGTSLARRKRFMSLNKM